MLFGTSGIRGLYGSQITESLAKKISSIFSDKALAIGRDTRESGPSLENAASESIQKLGKNVYALGVVPTPTVALATMIHKSNGIMVTASHNPDEYNGLKLIVDGHEISKEREKQIEFDYQNKVYPEDSAEPGSLFHDSQIITQHKELIKSNIDQSLIQKKKPKVVLDCNGAGCVITPQLLSDLGCDVISINAEVGPFNRPSEPNEANLSALKSLVPRLGADLGLAHDGDGDRTVAIDEKGNMVPFDIQLALMIQAEMRKSKNKKIISTMEASLTIRDTVEKENGSIIITPVGSTHVAAYMKSENAIFGGEPCGEYIYKDGVHVPDGSMAAAKLVEMFCRNGLLSAQAKLFKTHHMARERFECIDKYKVIDAVKEDIKIEGLRSEEDGVRIDEDDGWFLIRASGTEPIIRLTMEYIDKKKLDKRKDELGKIINEKIKSFS